MRALTFGDMEETGTNLGKVACAPESTTSPATYGRRERLCGQLVSGLADVGTEVIRLLSRLHEWPSRIRRAPRGRGGFSKQEIGRMAKKGLLR